MKANTKEVALKVAFFAGFTIGISLVVAVSQKTVHAVFNALD
jgi:hypothetical protein